jgi:hypothetical protein
MAREIEVQHSREKNKLHQRRLIPLGLQIEKPSRQGSVNELLSPKLNVRQAAARQVKFADC